MRGAPNLKLRHQQRRGQPLATQSSEPSSHVRELGSPGGGGTPEGDSMVQGRNVAAATGSGFRDNSAPQNESARKFRDFPEPSIYVSIQKFTSVQAERHKASEPPSHGHAP